MIRFSKKVLDYLSEMGCVIDKVRYTHGSNRYYFPVDQGVYVYFEDEYGQRRSEFIAENYDPINSLESKCETILILQGMKHG